jgi:hypothetical protein
LRFGPDLGELTELRYEPAGRIVDLGLLVEPAVLHEPAERMDGQSPVRRQPADEECQLNGRCPAEAADPEYGRRQRVHREGKHERVGCPILEAQPAISS